MGTFTVTASFRLCTFANSATYSFLLTTPDAFRSLQKCAADAPKAKHTAFLHHDTGSARAKTHCLLVQNTVCLCQNTQSGLAKTHSLLIQNTESARAKPNIPTARAKHNLPVQKYSLLVQKYKSACAKKHSLLVRTDTVCSFLHFLSTAKANALESFRPRQRQISCTLF
jgi:hypothetical protein